MNMILSIITATYNRAYCLENIYKSILRNENYTDVEWLLIDDGSTDNTYELAKKWKQERKINFRYYKKENAGKTRAVKYGFDKCPLGKYTLILDSDDYLSDNLFNIIRRIDNKLDESHIGIMGLKAFTNGKIVGNVFSKEEATYIETYFGKNPIVSDKLFVIRTEVYKNSYMLPFEDEKFLPDNIPYLNANYLGKYKLVNEIFYFGDYLDDGMTNNVFRMAMNNINGYIYEKKRLQEEKTLPLKHKLINTVKYIYYSILGKKNACQIVKYSGNKLLTILLYPFVLIGLYSKRRKMLKKLKR